MTRERSLCRRFKIFKKCSNSGAIKLCSLSRMAGVLGFEPRDDGIKTRCLTTWRHPNSVLWKAMVTIFKRLSNGSLFGVAFSEAEFGFGFLNHTSRVLCFDPFFFFSDH